MNQKDDKDLVFELLDHCRDLRFRKEGPHLLQGARNMRLLLVALETLRLYDDTRVQPLPSSATQLPRLETLHLTSPQFGLADRTGLHSDTMRSIIISGGKFHEDHVRDILMSMPNLSSLEYEADDDLLVTKSRTNDLGDTLRKFGGGLTRLALRISSYQSYMWDLTGSKISCLSDSLKDMTSLRFLGIEIQHLIGAYHDRPSRSAGMLPGSIGILSLYESCTDGHILNKKILTRADDLVTEILTHRVGLPLLWGVHTGWGARPYFDPRVWRRVPESDRNPVEIAFLDVGVGLKQFYRLDDSWMRRHLERVIESDRRDRLGREVNQG